MTANPQFEGADPSTHRTNQRTTFPPPPSFTAPKCPYLGNRNAAGQGTRIQEWWPNRLNVHLLRPMSDRANPLGAEFSYREAFSKLDYFGLKEDLKRLMTDSQEWWPADFGHYGPFFVRLAWHSAGTYRIQDGRGGAANGVLHVAPLHAWPDNANLDKARRLLWPLKQKYGSAISWSDLIILSGNVALESMGFKTLGFAGGRVDMWRPDEATYWGAEKKWHKNDKRNQDGKDEGHEAVDMEVPLSEDTMGLVVYVNPEGPNHNPDPLKAAELIRETFRRMAMHDDETVALIAGGHTTGKCHGMISNEHVGDDPEAAAINSMEQQGLGWRSYYKSGVGRDATTSGLEVTWTDHPIEFSHRYFQILFENEWEHEKSPAGLHQWVAKNKEPIIPHAYDKGVKLPQRMLTIDLALRFDPIFEPISRRFLNHPDEFADAFARAWFKLIHRDLGPIDRYLGPEIPAETFIWQDPITRHVGKHKDQDNSDLVVSRLTDQDIPELKSLIQGRIDDGRVTSQDLVVTAWGSAATFRGSDKRGGANGAHIRLQPQRSWAVNNPPRLEKVLNVYEEVQRTFNGKGKSVVSMADLIVLGGCVAVEQAIRKNGQKAGGNQKGDFYSNFTVPFTPGRGDATQEQTEIFSFAPMEPMADGFRNYNSVNALKCKSSTEDILLDRAQLLGLTIVEFTVLIGGLRALGANFDDSKLGVLTETVGTLDNSFFINLLTMDTIWKPVSIPAPEDSDMDKRLGSFNEDHRDEEAARFSFASEACKADIKKLEAANAAKDEQEKANEGTFFGGENPDKAEQKRLEDLNADARKEVWEQEMKSRRDDARDGKMDPDQKKRREGVDEALEEHKAPSLIGRIAAAVVGGAATCKDEDRTYAEADNDKDAPLKDDEAKEGVKKREAANEKNSIVKDKKADNVRDDKKEKPLAEYFEGKDRKTGALRWTASRADLVFGANSELRPIAEVYAQNGSNEKFIKDFVAAWCKVMDADRFDLETK